MPDIADRATVSDQYRTYDFDDIEVRADSDEWFTFEGVASVVDRAYTVADRFGSFEETIQTGAFNKTLAELKKRTVKHGEDVALFVNHDRVKPPLATVGSGRLSFVADPHLRVQATLNPRRPSVQEIREAVKDGDMRQMSIGFRAVTAKDQWNGDMTEVVRTEVGLREASIVWQGANPGTIGTMRSLGDFLGELVDVDMDEDELRRGIAELQRRLPAEQLEELPPVAAGVSRDQIMAIWNKRLIPA